MRTRLWQAPGPGKALGLAWKKRGGVLEVIDDVALSQEDSVYDLERRQAHDREDE